MPEKQVIVVDFDDPARQLADLAPDKQDLAGVFAATAEGHGFPHWDETVLPFGNVMSCVGITPRRVLALFFASSASAVGRVPHLLAALRKYHELAGALVLCDGFRLPGPVAMNCILAGASAAIDWDEPPVDFEKKVHKLVTNKPLFPRLGPSALKEKEAFIITPYPSATRKGASHDYYLGVSYALEELKIKAVLAEDHEGKQYLKQNVEAMIEKADLSIVNLNSYGDGRNPNVYWEYGFAEGRNKPVIVVHDPAFQAPADFRGMIGKPYQTPAHLLHLLYFGLRHLA